MIFLPGELQPTTIKIQPSKQQAMNHKHVNYQRKVRFESHASKKESFHKIITSHCQTSVTLSVHTLDGGPTKLVKADEGKMDTRIYIYPAMIHHLQINDIRITQTTALNVLFGSCNSEDSQLADDTQRSTRTIFRPGD